MARAPFATWRGSPNFTPGGMDGHPRGVVFHVEQGTEQGTDAVFAEPTWQASAHFGNPKVGPPDQYVDTADRAWAQADGNPHFWSIEHEALTGEALNDNQIRNDVLIVNFLLEQEPFPLELIDDPNGSGIGWHGMGGDAWGGHLQCPGEPIKAQRQDVIDLINQEATGGFLMALSDQQQTQLFNWVEGLVAGTQAADADQDPTGKPMTDHWTLAWVWAKVKQIAADVAAIRAKLGA